MDESKCVAQFLHRFRLWIEERRAKKVRDCLLVVQLERAQVDCNKLKALWELNSTLIMWLHLLQKLCNLSAYLEF